MTVRLSKEHQQFMIAEIIRFFYRERNEVLTEFEAERILEFIENRMSSFFYNAALYDVQYVLEQQYCNMEDEILSLSLEHPMKKITNKGH